MELGFGSESQLLVRRFVLPVDIRKWYIEHTKSIANFDLSFAFVAFTANGGGRLVIALGKRSRKPRNVEDQQSSVEGTWMPI